jgi:hypothetical protein
MSRTFSKTDPPTSFGAFKPVGHLMVGLPSREAAAAYVAELKAAGWPDDAIVEFTPREGAEELQELIDRSSPLAGFGYEITLMRRYLNYAREGYCWRLVRIDDRDASKAADAGRAHGAAIAVLYHPLAVEEMY